MSCSNPRIPRRRTRTNSIHWIPRMRGWTARMTTSRRTSRTKVFPKSLPKKDPN
jgi:hypothetical protein